MKLIVGLGNPGFDNTRHNLGFMLIDNIISNLNLAKKVKFNGEYYEYITENNEKIILLKPLSYMNLSGTVIKKYVDYFKIDVNNMLILFDDMDMELGKIRVREQGRSGGHNGIKDIISNLNTETFKRIKIGIFNKETFSSTLLGKDYVLSKFSKTEKEVIEDSIKRAAKVCIDYINNDNFEFITNNDNKNKTD